jgi:hypothetical protein
MKYVLQNKEYPIGEQISYYHEVLIVKENHIVETNSNLSRELLIKDDFILIEEEGKVLSAKDLKPKKEKKEVKEKKKVTKKKKKRK